VAGLCGRVNDGGGFQLANECQHAGPVADIEFMVNKPREGLLQSSLVPSGVALWSKEHRPLIVVETVDLVAQLVGEINANLGTNQPRRTGDENDFGHGTKIKTKCGIGAKRILRAGWRRGHLRIGGGASGMGVLPMSNSLVQTHGRMPMPRRTSAPH